ncbi:MAG: response regulator transcription factor [Acidobacteria bacterium]|nr:response regulator transcription factor [Acidobacteriota bacterium]
MVAKKVPARRLTVCLLSPHPLVLGEFQRLLARPGFLLLTRRLESTLVPDLRRLTLPRASVYVVDALGHRPATEALVVSLLERFPNARLLVVSEKFSEVNSFPLLRLGVKGLICYAEAHQQLRRALETLARGGFWVPRSVLSRFVDDMLSSVPGHRRLSGTTGLSRREQEVLDCLLENLANKEIADKLHISERTVKFHVSNLLSKFGVRRRADLILLSLQSRPAPS